MVSEPDIGRCASEDTRPSRKIDCEIPHRLERGTKHSYKDVETAPKQMCFKTLSRSPKGKDQIGQYPIAVDLAVTNGIRVRHRAVCQ